MKKNKTKITRGVTRCGEHLENCPIYGNGCNENIEICPIYRTFHIVGKKWTLQILQEFSIHSGIRRYNEIQKSLYWITPRVLSKRLKEMEDEGLITRKIDSKKIPVRVNYSLTKKGKELDRVIEEARQWGKKWEVEEEKVGGSKK